MNRALVISLLLASAGAAGTAGAAPEDRLTAILSPRSTLPRLEPLLQRAAALLPELDPALLRRGFEPLGVDPLDPRALERVGVDVDAPFVASVDDTGRMVSIALKDGATFERALEAAASARAARDPLRLLARQPKIGRGFVAGPPGNPRLVGLVTRNRLFLAPHQVAIPPPESQHEAQAKTLVGDLSRRGARAPQAPRIKGVKADLFTSMRVGSAKGFVRAALRLTPTGLEADGEVLRIDGLPGSGLLVAQEARRLLGGLPAGPFPVRLAALLTPLAMGRAMVRLRLPEAAASAFTGELEVAMTSKGGLVMTAGLSANAGRAEVLTALLGELRRRGLEGTVEGPGRRYLVVTRKGERGKEDGAWTEAVEATPGPPAEARGKRASMVLEVEPGLLLEALSGLGQVEGLPSAGRAEMAMLQLAYGDLLASVGNAKLTVSPKGRNLAFSGTLEWRARR